MTSSIDPQVPIPVSLAESGPTFEIYRGQGGAIRYDWTRAGLIRMIILGHGHAGYAAPAIKHFDTVVRFTGQIGVFFDCWDMTGYDSGFRVETSGWAAKHKPQIGACYMVTRSKLVSMGISVANLAIGGKISCFSRRVEFDLEAKKAGFPLNPPMPGR